MLLVWLLLLLLSCAQGVWRLPVLLFVALRVLEMLLVWHLLLLLSCDSGVERLTVLLLVALWVLQSLKLEMLLLRHHPVVVNHDEITLLLWTLIPLCQDGYGNTKHNDSEEYTLVCM